MSSWQQHERVGRETEVRVWVTVHSMNTEIHNREVNQE